MSAIAEITGREILDSRGNPTVEAEIILEDGSIGRACAPSGASVGGGEAAELRDGDSRYCGKGVAKAVDNINGEIADALIELDAREQLLLDETLIALDGAENKSRLGANAIVAVSLAAAKAAAESCGLSFFRYLGGLGPPILPVPLMNIINGGAHANNNLDVQEFMVVPAGFETFSDSLRCGAEVYRALAEMLKSRGLSTAVGDEGGFAPDLPDSESALSLIMQAIESAGYRPGEDAYLAVDCAASEFYKDDNYRLEKKDFSAAELTARFQKWSREFPLISIEDGMAENDWDGWKLLTNSLGATTQLVGDDLFATNPKILREGIARGAANAVLIKPNQIGTLSETIRAMEIANAFGYSFILSHRSGDTDDSIIADIAVAFGAGQIKTGAPCRGERVAKYNQLLRIEEELGDSARFAGRAAFRHLR